MIVTYILYMHQILSSLILGDYQIELLCEFGLIQHSLDLVPSVIYWQSLNLAVWPQNRA